MQYSSMQQESSNINECRSGNRLIGSQTPNLNISIPWKEKDNPNAVQRLMAQDFIRYVVNLFDENENFFEESRERMEHYLKPLHSFKSSVKELQENKSLQPNNKSYFVSSDRNGIKPSALTCRSIGPKNVEFCGDSLVDNIHPQKKQMADSLTGSLVRKIHSNLSPRCINKRSFPSSLLHFFRRKNHSKISGQGRLKQDRLRIASEITNESRAGFLKRQVPWTNRASLSPPLDFYPMANDSPHCRWQRGARYDWITSPWEYRFNLAHKRRSRCRNRKSTTAKCSLNQGKTAKISFPLTHRCILQTCPCRVTKMCLPPKTTCSLPDIDSETATKRCEGMDMLLETASNPPLKCSEISTTPIDVLDDRFEYARGKRFTGDKTCLCQCGCPCAQGIVRPHQQGLVGKAACGCSCGCGCSHGQQINDHLHLSPNHYLSQSKLNDRFIQDCG